MLPDGEGRHTFVILVLEVVPYQVEKRPRLGRHDVGVVQGALRA
jgi:hypothetical protein